MTSELLRPLVDQAVSGFMSERRHGALNARDLALACERAMARNHADWSRFASEKISPRYGKRQLLEVFVPQVAREIGRRWEEDDASFAEVTLAGARLQSLAMASGDAYAGRPAAWLGKPAESKAFFIVPEQENHRIGGIVAARRAQSLGLDICLSLGDRYDALLEQIRREDARVFGVSVGSRRMLAPARDLIRRLRDDVADCTVVLGGHILELVSDREETSDADLATNNLEEAVEFMKLRLKERQTKTYEP